MLIELLFSQHRVIESTAVLCSRLPFRIPREHEAEIGPGDQTHTSRGWLVLEAPGRCWRWSDDAAWCDAEGWITASRGWRAQFVLWGENRSSVLQPQEFQQWWACAALPSPNTLRAAPAQSRAQPALGAEEVDECWMNSQGVAAFCWWLLTEIPPVQWHHTRVPASVHVE